MSGLATTVFEIVGGQPFFDALVDRFYRRVETDPVLRALDPEDLEPGKRGLALFLGQYWGGAAAPSGAKGHPRRRMRQGRLSPDRWGPASIPRPPYAPDAPPLVPAVPPDEFADRMRAAGHAAREVLLELRDAVRVGITTDELDRICHDACVARGGYPSP